MKTFEVHITGEKGINEELDALEIKNIIVELLNPDETLLRTEYMSSFIIKCENYQNCFEHVRLLKSQLKSKIIRTKIECPVYDDYIDQSIYVESHFKPLDNIYPLSRNQKSGKLLGTDREYDKTKYSEFIEMWKHEDRELCLYDSFVEEDFDWFEKYKK